LIVPPGTADIYKNKGWKFKTIEETNDGSNSVSVNSATSGNNTGNLNFATSIPTSEQYTGSFAMYLPTGVELDNDVSVRSLDTQNTYTVEMQQISANGYIVNIQPSSNLKTRSGTQPTYQDMLNIAYKINMPLLEDDNFITISNMLLVGNSDVIYQDEIQVILKNSVTNEVLPDRGKLLYYPNPVDNTLTVQIPNPNEEKAVIALINLYGQTVYRAETHETTHQVDVQSLKRGIYILQVTVGNEKHVAKVIKKNVWL
jgi:hypothetical protein